MSKPTDFFVTVTDLFSVVLPGAVLAFIAMRIEQQLKMDALGLLTLHGTEGYVAFLVVAYLLGHVTDLIGASLIDTVYDLTYAHWKRSQPTTFWLWMVETPLRLSVALKYRLVRIFSVQVRESPLLEDDLFRRARGLAGFERPAGVNVYKWSRIWMTLKSPSASSEVERLQANSKFFRAMVPVSAFVCVSSFSMQCPFTSVGGWACLLLTLASFLRYSDLRWKAVEQTYAFFVALRSRTYEPVSPKEPASTDHG